MNASPKTQALLFRIWAYANPIGWNCTPCDLADYMGVSVQTIGAVLKCKPHWINRLRVGKKRIDETSRFDQPNKNLELIQ